MVSIPTQTNSAIVEFNRRPSSEHHLAITLDQVHFSYPGQASILNGISLRVKVGERVGFIGHNGCGKTTLFRLLCGLLVPTLGLIHLLDQPVELGAFRSEVGLLFQIPEDQLFSPTVWDDISFGPYNLGLSEAEVHQRVEQALGLTGTQYLTDRAPHQLSGGEKQMVAIAGLLAMNPRVILYDEPTASLDLRSRRRLIQFLQRSRQTMVMASHDLEFLLEVCDRVILIDAGQVVADGEIRAIMSNQELMESHGLEKPHSLEPHRERHH